MAIAERLRSHVFSHTPPGRRGGGAEPRLSVVTPPAISRTPLRGVALLPFGDSLALAKDLLQDHGFLSTP